MSLRGGALITSPLNRPRMRVPETPPLSPISHARVGFSFGIRRGLATGKRKGRATMSMQSVTASSHPTLSYTDSLAASTSDTLLLIARILMLDIRAQRPGQADGHQRHQRHHAGSRAAGMARLCGRARG